LSAIFDHLLSVEGALAPGESLHEDAGGFIYQDAQVVLSIE
jgi:hypothetical protein